MAPPKAGCNPGEPCSTPGNERTTAVVVGVRDANGKQDWNLVVVTLTSKTSGTKLTGVGPSGANAWGAAFRFPAVVEGDYVLEAIGRGPGGAVTGKVQQVLTARLVEGKDQFLNVTLVPVAAPPGDISFVDADGNVLTEVEYGLWDNAAERGASGVTLLNEESDDRNFVGGDSRRFFILVKDTSIAPNTFISASWWTANSALGSVSDAPTSLSLEPRSGRIGEFISKAIMLVNNNDDLVDVHDGRTGVVSVGTFGYRMKRANLGQAVVASYGSGSTAAFTAASVFARRKKLTIRLYVHKDASGPCRSSAGVLADVDRAKEIFGRFGVQVEASADPAMQSVLDANPVTGASGSTYYEMDLSSYLDSTGLFDKPSCSRAVNDHFSAKGKWIDVFYVPRIDEPGAVGVSNTIPRDGVQDPKVPENLNGTSRIVALDRQGAPAADVNTLAHELVHHIGNKEKKIKVPNPPYPDIDWTISHFIEPSDVTRVGARLLKELCIITDGSLMGNGKGALGPVRLWDAPDKDMWFWTSTAFASSYLEDVP